MPLDDGLTMRQLDHLAALLAANADVQALFTDAGVPSGTGFDIFPATGVSEAEEWAFSLHTPDTDRTFADKASDFHASRVILRVQRFVGPEADGAAVRALYRETRNMVDHLAEVLGTAYRRDPTPITVPGGSHPECLWHKLTFLTDPTTITLLDPQGKFIGEVRFDLTGRAR